MEHLTGILGTHWFHRRFTLTPAGHYVTVTELAEWARGPYDQLHKNLLLPQKNGNGGVPRVVLLAPARHGDGTTTTAVLLAASLATAHRCLLMDLNFRRPGVGAALGLNGASGLGTLLRDANGRDVGRTILPTRVPNLFALPNTIDGAQHTLPEIDAVRAVVGQLRDRFDYVVIDAAPVLGYPDTPLLAAVADAALLIVAADSTPVNSCLAARREIERGGRPILGVVVTRQRRFVPNILARRLGPTE
jgi:Mrp family chromosome partitioning ATPase